MQPHAQGEQFAKYQLNEMLGEGSFARVHRARDLETGKEVALKIFKGIFPDQTSLDELGKEAEVTKSLDHPNIVRVHRFAVEGKVPYLVMDYVPYSWRSKHALGTPLSLDLVLKYAKQLSTALQYAHDRRVVHRDLKPANLLLNDKDDLLLGDFGIARMLTVSGFDFTQHVAGTLQYMAPEAFEGAIERACDQYSLGIIVYEWLTGKRPFEGTFTELWHKHVYTAPEPLTRLRPELSPDIEQAVLQALAKKPHQRFQNVQAFATKIEQAISPQPARSPAPASTVQAASPTPPQAPVNNPVAVPPITPAPAPAQQAPAQPVLSPQSAAPAPTPQPPMPPAAPPVQAVPPAMPAPTPQAPAKSAKPSGPQAPAGTPPPGPAKSSPTPPASPPASAPAGPPASPQMRPPSAPQTPAPSAPANAPLVIGQAKPIQPPTPGPAPAAPGQTPPASPAQPGSAPPPQARAPQQSNPFPGPWNPLAGELPPPRFGSPFQPLPRQTPGAPAQTPPIQGLPVPPAPPPAGPPEAAAPPPVLPPAANLTPAGTPPPVPPPVQGLPTPGGQPSAGGGFRYMTTPIGLQPIQPPPAGVQSLFPAGPAPMGTSWAAGTTGNYNAPTISGQPGQPIPTGSFSAFPQRSAETGQKGTRVCVYPAHASPVKDIYWFPYGSQILSLDEQMAHSWETTQGMPTASTTILHQNSVWSPDRAYAVSLSAQGISVYNMLHQPPTPLPAPYQGHRGEVRAITWLYGSSYLASTGSDRTIHIWEAGTGRLARNPQGGPYQGIYQAHVRPVTHLAASPDGTLLASAEEGGNIQVWDPKDGHTVSGYTGHQEKLRRQGNISTLQWSPDGRHIASQAGNEIRVWEALTGKTVSTREALPANPLMLWSPDGRHLASRGNTGRGVIDIWDSATGKTQLTCDCGDPLTTLVWSPNGKILAAGAGRTVQLWDARSGEQLLIYTGHTAPVTSIAWSPDGKQIASGDAGDHTASQIGHPINAQVHVWLTAGVEQSYGHVLLYRAFAPLHKVQRKLGKAAFRWAVAASALDIAVFVKVLIASYPSLTLGALFLELLPIELVIWSFLGKKRLHRTLLHLALIPLVALWGIVGWSLGAPASITWVAILTRIIAVSGSGIAAFFVHRKVFRRL